MTHICMQTRTSCAAVVVAMVEVMHTPVAVALCHASESNSGKPLVPSLAGACSLRVGSQYIRNCL